MMISTLGVAFAVAVVWATGLVLYRLYLSPLSRFPGRKLAIATMWYEFYYQAIKKGQYPWIIQKMHAEYGPIIRINPHELHINDPAFYDEIYNYKQLDKYRWHTNQFGHPHSSANTVEHDLHKLRTSAIAPYFSRGNILRLEQEVIQETLLKLCKRIDGFRASGQPMPLGVAYRAFTTDVISKYTMAISFGFLDKPDFNETWFKEFLENVSMVHIISHFPWYLKAVKKLPIWLRSFLVPVASQMIQFHHIVQQQVAKTANADTKVETKSESIPTVFYEMAHNEKVPAEEKSLDRLTDEGVLFIVAGNETTGNTLSTITYHLLRSPRVLALLKAELASAIPDTDTVPLWRDLEPLPYLSAVIKEGLRLSYGVVSRMPRVSPSAPLRYKDHVIPPNTPVSMNTMDMHDDGSVFVDPKAFDPDRWLRSSDEQMEGMGRQLVPFCRGTRACVGMNLAYAELYITLATLFRRYEMGLFETGEEDVEVRHEYHIPQVKKGSKGVRVLVK